MHEKIINQKDQNIGIDYRAFDQSYQDNFIIQTQQLTKRHRVVSLCTILLILTLLVLCIFSVVPTGDCILLGVLSILGLSIYLKLDTINIDRNFIKQFASDNNFTYTQNYINIGGDARIYSMGKENSAQDVVGGVINGQGFWFGNFSYTLHDTVFTLGMIEVTLNNNLPNIFLASRYKKSSDIPFTTDFSLENKFQLEGDFNKYFEVYLPAGYGRDALYIFTPKIMALFIDYAPEYNIEISQNKIYLHRVSGSCTYAKEDISGIMMLIQMLTDEFAKGVNRYSDEKSVTNNEISISGRSIPKNKLAFIAAIFLVSFFTIIYILGIIQLLLD